MKTILEFEADEKEDLYFAQHGALYSCVIHDLDNWLRNLSKYEDKTTVNINDVRSTIFELMDKYDVK